ncbi:MAG: CRISPR-associated endonuclease Cas2 [Clostridia bacterium]|nr:CRISPR-associated endonuclease Cas2 [Clostridia bacterium]
MRVIVFFDLPVGTKPERYHATKFRNYLLSEGYYMIQFSVYGRLCNGIDAAYKHEKRLLDNVPSLGSVRVLTITEKQYTAMKILSGEKKEKEKPQESYQLSFF